MVNLDCSSQVCNGGTGSASKCLTGSDCTSGACNPSTFVCEPASCTNGMKDGFETAVDCGGPTCGPCGDNQTCQTNLDCVSGICDVNNTCKPASCSDGLKNGSETSADCGGG